VTASLEIRVLGPFEVCLSGRPVSVAGSKRQALLALLALRRGRVIAVDALIEALWGEELPSAPRNALQHHVARIRAALGQEAITASSDGYALLDGAVDALRFEELLAEARAALREGDVRAAAESVALALGLWRGPALHGLTDIAWFAAEARRLDGLRLDGLEERFEVALALGEHREIVSQLREAIEQDPFRERLWGQLMLALYRSGRQAEALETFQEARRVLADELGLEPGPDLRRLQEAILSQDAAIVYVPPARRRSNLPLPSTSFVGRGRELAQLHELLREQRLVTLVGPPGVGKSRLAAEAVRALEDETPDGVWLVDLARAGGPADVVRLLAYAVDARGADTLESVVARLRGADTLVVLDACEQVLEEAGRVAAALLAGCPRVRVVATSRSVLHVPGEARLRVEPLSVTHGEALDPAGAPAVELFVERARAARPGFELTADSARVVAEIAQLVDGLPLAIELAAARVNVLGLGELHSVVERRLALLVDRPGSDPARSSLRSLVDWSYDLLHSDEKTLLQQLAVHRGGASLASLVAMAASHGLDETTVAYLLGTLADKSIVSVSFATGAARYDVLDTVREYALERLAESGELVSARKAHAAHFAALALTARSELRGPEWLSTTARLALDNENLWAALSFARDASDGGVAVELGGSLGWYFLFADRVSEGRRFLELALSLAPEDVEPELELELLAFLSYLTLEELDVRGAIELAERGLALADAGPEGTGAALVRLPLALALAQAGDDERAALVAEEARLRFKAGGDDWGVALAALITAQAAARAADVETVAARVPELLTHAEAAGFDAFRVPGLLLEGWAAERLGNPAAAEDAYRRALSLAARVGFDDHSAFALALLGSLALASGELEQAEQLERQACEAADGAGALWVAAHATAELGRVLARRGDVEGAEASFRHVLELDENPRTRRSRESLFAFLAGSPVTTALLGLAELAEARGDSAAADGFRARAGLALT